MSRLEAFGTILAGFGFFFVGFRLLSSSMRALYSRRLRLWLASLTSRRLAASLLGVLSGLLIQSAPCFTFVQAGAASAGLIDVRRMLPVIFGVNVGCSLLVWISVFDCSSLILYPLGIFAIASVFVRDRTWKLRIDVLLAVSLVFYGLHVIKVTAAQALSSQHLTAVVMSSGQSLVWTFLIGAGLAALTQSSIAITMVALSLAHAGLFHVNQMVMLVYGTMLGVSLLVWTLSWKLKGAAKQIAIAQVLFDAGGVALFLALFLIEYLTGIPLVVSLITWTDADLSRQIANLYVLFNVVAACGLTLIANPLHSILVSSCPPTEEELRSKLQYLTMTANLDTAMGIDLAGKELFRNIASLQTYLAAVETTRDGKSTPSWDALRDPFKTISCEIDAVLEELSSRPLAARESAALVDLLRREELARHMEDELAMLAQKIVEARRRPELSDFAAILFESANAILATLLDAVHSRTQENVGIALAVTSDKGDALTRLRSAYAARMATHEQRAELTDLAMHFERWAWHLNRFARLMKPNGITSEN